MNSKAYANSQEGKLHYFLNSIFGANKFQNNVTYEHGKGEIDFHAFRNDAQPIYLEHKNLITQGEKLQMLVDKHRSTVSSGNCSEMSASLDRIISTWNRIYGGIATACSQTHGAAKHLGDGYRIIIINGLGSAIANWYGQNSTASFKIDSDLSADNRLERYEDFEKRAFSSNLEFEKDLHSWGNNITIKLFAVPSLFKQKNVTVVTEESFRDMCLRFPTLETLEKYLYWRKNYLNQVKSFSACGEEDLFGLYQNDKNATLPANIAWACISEGHDAIMSFSDKYQLLREKPNYRKLSKVEFMFKIKQMLNSK